MNQAIVIFSGYNMRAVVAFCRTAVSVNIPFHILAASDQDPVFKTRYCESVFLTRESSELCIADVLTWLQAIRSQMKYERLVILPTSEFLNRWLLEHQQTLEDAGCLVPLVDADLYGRISNKHSFARTCSEHQLAVPREFDSLPSELPFVAKPLRYASSQHGKQLKPWLVTSQSLLEQFQQQEHLDDFFFQELANGRSTYLLYFVSRNNHDVLFSQENLIQQCNGGSIIAARQSSAHTLPIAQQYLQMCKSLGYWGVLMVELKETTHGYVMIEANPRFWGPLQFAVDNEVPIIEQFLVECGFQIESPPDNSAKDHTANAEFYFWSGGMTRSAQPLLLHNYSESRFLVDYPDMISHDVFLRDDTLNLYASEIRERT